MNHWTKYHHLNLEELEEDGDSMGDEEDKLVFLFV